MDRTIAAESVAAGEEEFRLVSPVELKGRLEPLETDAPRDKREEASFRLRARLSCRLELDCVRCLEPFQMDVNESVNAVYLPQSLNVAPQSGDDPDSREDDRGLESDELSVSYYRDRQIDLSHTIVEQIVLSLPMKPLCRDECRGLCPDCGVNRNEASCDCAPDESDPRWSALKTLLGR